MLRPFLWDLRCRALGPSIQFLRVLEREQFLNLAETRALQTLRLEKLLAHAYRTVPYYTRTLERCGAVRNGAVDLASFCRIPPLQRALVQNRDAQFVSSTADFNSALWCASGGSTGLPAQVLLDRETRAWFQAVQTFFDSWTGYSPGRRRMLLWGSVHDLSHGKESFRTYLGRWLRNEVALNAFRMDFERIRRYLRSIDRSRPALLVGYADGLGELARLAEREHISIRSPGAVMSTAGTLYPEMRATLEKVLNAPVFDRYGCREVGDIACEDQSHAGLIVCAPTHYVEIVRPDGTPCVPGETGELLVTFLANYAMPIIRYCIGDLGAWAAGSSRLGRPWPVLQHVADRISDAFRRADGSALTPLLFAHMVGVVLNDGWVHKYQVIQEDIDEFRVLIVPADGDLRPDSHEARFAGISSKMRTAIGPNCHIRFELVHSIEPTASGKHRWLVCKVPAAARVSTTSQK